MNISKQLIDQKMRTLLKNNSEFFKKDEERNLSKAFLLLGVAAYLDIDIVEADQYITDGSADGGFDAAYIDESGDSELNVILFQSKYVRDLDKDSVFPYNAMEKAVNTIKSIFDSKKNISLNENSRRKVDEIRSFISDGYIPYVKFVMINNGKRWDAIGEQLIENEFGNQNQVEFEHFSHEEIVGYINKKKVIKEKLTFSGKAVLENYNYKRVIIGRVNVGEIYRLMERHGDALLEKNIRRYLGKNEINEGIISTLRDEKKRNNFFFFNNGITMICNKMSHNALQSEDWIVLTEHLQIINGGQTCRAISEVVNSSNVGEFSDVYVLVRLYEVSDDEQMINDITFATNSQNPVDFRDLKSNDNRLLIIEQSAQDLGYVFKRKRDNNSTLNAIPSNVAAEAVLAIWRKMPHVAKYKKNELFGKYFENIFNDLNAPQMIIAVLIFRYADSNRKKTTDDCEISAHRAYNKYFLSFMVGNRLLKECGLELSQLDHKSFGIVLNKFEESKELYFDEAEHQLTRVLLKHFNVKTLLEIDGRTIAAVFRRFDLLEKLT